MRKIIGESMDEIWKFVISGIIGGVFSIIVALIAYGIPAIMNRPKTQAEITDLTQDMLKEAQGMLKDALSAQNELQRDKESLKKEIEHIKAAKTADYDLHIIFSIYPEPKIKLAELKALRAD
jgi:hypothetical protein